MAKAPETELEIRERYGPHGNYVPPGGWTRSAGPGEGKLVKTHCCFCGQQCGIQLRVRDNQVVGFEPWEDFPFNRGMSAGSKRPFSRDQRTTIVYGMLVFVLIVVVLQLWLLTATMNAWLGGDDVVVWPAAAVSAAGLALNLGLLKYLGRIERRAGA